MDGREKPGARSRACIACMVGIALALLVASPAGAAPPPKHNPPKSIYLALGDSLAFGYQQARFIQDLPTEDPAAFNTGYVDDFARALRTIKPNIQTVNLGCPGETTDSLLGLAPCLYPSSVRVAQLLQRLADRRRSPSSARTRARSAR
jgi:lysophospholipase L1-like esterase